MKTATIIDVLAAAHSAAPKEENSMDKCDECQKNKEVDYYSYPGGSLAQLCARCADDCGFDLATRELQDLTGVCERAAPGE